MPIAALAGLVWGPNVLQLIPEIGDPEKIHIAVRRLLSFILIVMRCVVLGFGELDSNKPGIGWLLTPLSSSPSAAFWELSIAPHAAYFQICKPTTCIPFSFN